MPVTAISSRFSFGLLTAALAIGSPAGSLGARNDVPPREDVRLSDRGPSRLPAFLVEDINTAGPDQFGSVVDRFVTAGSHLYFPAQDRANGNELWKSDGTPDGTVLVSDISPGGSADPSELTELDGTVYFAASSTSGRELWRSDGTPAGTALVKDIAAAWRSSEPRDLELFDRAIYFGAQDPIRGRELWRSDGTAEGTLPVKDIRAGEEGSDPQELTAVDGTLFFTASDGSSGRGLWKSDGSEAGTVLVKDLDPDSTDSVPYGLTSANGRLYFFTLERNPLRYQLWRSDGTEGETVRVREFAADFFTGPLPGGIPGYYGPSGLTEFEGNVFFFANDGSSGRELWRTDGTSGGTVLVRDIAVGPNGSIEAFQTLVEANGLLYFASDDGIHGLELWKSDGRSFGTALVRDILAGSESSNVQSLSEAGGALYFAAKDERSISGTENLEPWRSDGTE
ncbi:MAG TPA: ELWxxDGT repeat protein, partial [Thermoanaerobaculia bacterium]|nr:ELWxxDGT repeat protein [Thermoanaerobaculia bacterium]